MADRHAGTQARDAFLDHRRAITTCWTSGTESYQTAVRALKDRLAELEPETRIRGRKVYTVGCFDLFHRGHERMLRALRWFGTYVVVGIHDDDSYERLKSKRPIDSLATRMANVKPFADMVFVIPDVSPGSWLRAMVSQQDLDDQCTCYVRGEDMPNFPDRDQVEEWGMPVHLLPRSEGVSSTLLRKLYHGKREAAL